MSVNGVDSNKQNKIPIELEAIEVATRAEVKIDAYIKSNNDKYTTIITSIKELKDDQKILFNRWWMVSGSFILILLSINGYLINKLI